MSSRTGGREKQLRRSDQAAVPKGFVAVMVGGGAKEEQERFVVPVAYLNHHLFLLLLKEAEEEYGFDHDGPVTIPCRAEEFRRVCRMIDKETSRHDPHSSTSCFKTKA
ncbi:unnamed protein product [Cuscuta campestris]|uniref:Uncharacterized protein n=1 Tax=Cuscuta campestris TaxID=132261 RepID=A0A484KNH2_9ASTE|nr:unnamed protein product [Cuscuta campestris]